MIRSIYLKEDITTMEEDDELNSFEAGFMAGYNEAEI